ncbi:hypothetical protein EG328_002410 [Venturia inaequalis]|uniref:Heterokaryon incompatibility domain-containing protein n=1 Tax=Venturia inaequalis TaxID=5025 RepID=A0A8H3YWX5_VENIN|nr:hypothetical protein EG328_002410 [Venturia inaequalis]
MSRAVHRVLRNKQYQPLAQEDTHVTLLVQEHQYDPLRFGEESTRVIILQPAEDFDDELVCQIKAVKYREPGVQFEAISYAHDRSTFPEILVCLSGRSHSNLSISPNLSNALRHLRLPNAARTLWVDAICINQEDAQEKSSQIGQIGAIFAAAQRVSVWLGLPDEETADAFDFCQILADSTISCGLSKEHGFDVTHTDWISPGPKRARTGLACDLEHQRKGFAFQRLLGRSWFHRRWAIQDMFFARAVWVHCGSSMIEAKTLGLAMVTSHAIKTERACSIKSKDDVWCDGIDKNILGLASEPVRAESGSISSIVRYKKYHKRKRLPILHLLSKNEDANCSDPRDVVASQLGMSTMSSFTVDYSASVEETYIDFAYHCIHSHHPKHSPYEILHHAVRWKEDDDIPNAREGAQENLTLPSWVPDWRKKKPGLLLTSHPPVFRAATHLDARFVVSRDKRRITATGIRIGTIQKETCHAIQSLEEAWTDTKYTQIHAQYQLLTWKHIFETMSPPSTPNSSGGVGILASTLIAGALPFEIQRLLAPHFVCSTLEEVFDGVVAWIQSAADVETWPASARDYFRCFRMVMEQRGVFTVERGSAGTVCIGIGPEAMRGGDLLVLLLGAETPFLVREVGWGDGGGDVWYEVVGECFVDGLMKGEGYDFLFGEESFVIV